MFGIFDVSTPFFFGEAFYPNGGCYGPIEHSNICLYTVAVGSATVLYDDKRLTIEAGQSAIVCNNDSFTLYAPRNESSHVLWCETPFPTLLDQEKDAIQLLPSTIETPSQLLDLLKMGITYRHSKGANVFTLRNALAISTLNIFLHKAAKLTSEETPLPKSIEKVKKYISSNFRQPMNLTILAEIASLSPHHLARKFKEHLKVTPTTYIWQLRTEKGVDLLKHSGLTIAEAAFNSGFQTQYHFSRLVKQSYGYTPTEIRKMAWQRKDQEEKDQLKDSYILK